MICSQIKAHLMINIARNVGMILLIIEGVYSLLELFDFLPDHEDVWPITLLELEAPLSDIYQELGINIISFYEILEPYGNRQQRIGDIFVYYVLVNLRLIIHIQVYEILLWRACSTAVVADLFVLFLVFHPLLRNHNLAVYRLFLIKVFQD